MADSFQKEAMMDTQGVGAPTHWVTAEMAPAVSLVLRRARSWELSLGLPCGLQGSDSLSPRLLPPRFCTGDRKLELGAGTGD